MTFMFAGSDTTANTLAFCLYEIAQRPEVQIKIQEELQQVLGNTPTGGSFGTSGSAFNSTMSWQYYRVIYSGVVRSAQHASNSKSSASATMGQHADHALDELIPDVADASPVHRLFTVFPQTS